MSGEIRRLGKNPRPTRAEPQIIGQNEVRNPGEPEILDRQTPVEPTTADVRVHEEIKLEGEDNIRLRRENNGLELKLRTPVDREAWERIKRLEDE